MPEAKYALQHNFGVGGACVVSLYKAPQNPQVVKGKAFDFQNINWKLLQRGWESQQQIYGYWIPNHAIEGSLPAGLQGTFLRNGPGLLEVYGTALKHPIDGDGMVCAGFVSSHLFLH